MVAWLLLRNADRSRTLYVYERQRSLTETRKRLLEGRAKGTLDKESHAAIYGDDNHIKVPRFDGKRDENFSPWTVRTKAISISKGFWNAVDPLAENENNGEGREIHFSAMKSKAAMLFFNDPGDGTLRAVMTVGTAVIRMNPQNCG